MYIIIFEDVFTLLINMILHFDISIRKTTKLHIVLFKFYVFFRHTNNFTYLFYFIYIFFIIQLKKETCIHVTPQNSRLIEYNSGNKNPIIYKQDILE